MAGFGIIPVTRVERREPSDQFPPLCPTRSKVESCDQHPVPGAVILSDRLDFSPMLGLSTGCAKDPATG